MFLHYVNLMLHALFDECNVTSKSNKQIQLLLNCWVVSWYLTSVTVAGDPTSCRQHHRLLPGLEELPGRIWRPCEELLAWWVNVINFVSFCVWFRRHSAMTCLWLLHTNILSWVMSRKKNNFKNNSQLKLTSYIKQYNNHKHPTQNNYTMDPLATLITYTLYTAKYGPR